MMAYDPERITFFAKTDARGQQIPFGIKAEDRTKHVYVIGKTGMGKSTMLENMAVQDIKNGEGFAFIDPHGQTAETLLDYIPEDRIEDVLYFAPHDMEFPVSFNIMEDVGADKRHLVVSGLMSVFEKIWVDAWSARMAYILQNTLMALLEYPDSTLLGVNKMLSDKNYRNKVVAHVTDPAVKDFWEVEFAGYTDRFAAEATPAIQNKIGQFTANPVIRNIIGQPHSGFDIRKMMDEKKIIIMNLSKGLIGESNANLLGSMLTTRIYLSAMSRADLTPREMQSKPNFYFYVDEFQSFANATFANILSEARKYKLNLTIAHQYIEQMEEEVKNAVFGNVGTTITFRVGPFDAEVLETIFAPQFTAIDIVNLGAHQIYLSLMIDGIGSQPFSATTLPPIERPQMSCRDLVIASSRKQFGNPRAAVEQTVKDFHEPTPPSPKPEHNNNSGGPNKNGGSHSTQKSGRPHNDNKSQQGNRSSGANARSNGSNNRREVEQNTNQNHTRTDFNNRGGQQNQNGESETGRKPQQPLRREERKEKHDRGPRPQGDRPKPQSKPKEKNLDELRSILKGIAVPEPKKEEKPRPEESKKENQPKTDLKSALKSAGQTSTSPALEEKQAPSSTPAPKPDPAPQTPPQPPQPAPAPDPEPHAPPPHPSTSHVNDSVSPKELERMMRVTTSDKPPLK